MKTKKKKRRYSKLGLPPGTIIHTAESSEFKQEPVKMIGFNQTAVVEKIQTTSTLDPLEDIGMVKWYLVKGLHNTFIIENLCKKFHIHPLVIEDILNPSQRIKIDDYPGLLFVVVRAFFYDRDSKTLEDKQISFILQNNTLLSFEEESDKNFFEPILDRIRAGKGLVRTRSSDYLLYAVLDLVVDHYFLVMEDLEVELESLEESILSKPKDNTIAIINNLKKQLIYLKRSIAPVRDILTKIERGSFSAIHKDTYIFFRDVTDHLEIVLDSIESDREILTGILDIYLSSLNNKLSEVMKLLTLISTIFIPLTFIAGIYGMNFKHMPELENELGYPLTIAGMLTIALTMLILFKIKKWI